MLNFQFLTILSGLGGEAGCPLSDGMARKAAIYIVDPMVDIAWRPEGSRNRSLHKHARASPPRKRPKCWPENNEIRTAPMARAAASLVFVSVKLPTLRTKVCGDSS